MENKRSYVVLICECTSLNHSIAFWLDSDDSGRPMAYVHVSMANRPFWKRVGQAFNHIIGKRNSYGDFDEILIHPEDASKLRAIADHLQPQTT